MLSALSSSIIRFFTKNPYRKEISIVILLKLIALFLLWKLFFSHHDPELLTVPNLEKHFIQDGK